MFFWARDAMINNTHCIVCEMATSGAKPEWKKRLDKTTGGHKCQQDLAQDLIEKGIRMDWKDIKNKEGEPRLMR